MTVPECISTQLNELDSTIRLFKNNKASHPLSIANTQNKWWVMVEINSPHGTFDVEASDKRLDVALNTALARVKREAFIKQLGAA